MDDMDQIEQTDLETTDVTATSAGTQDSTAQAGDQGTDGGKVFTQEDLNKFLASERRKWQRKQTQTTKVEKKDAPASPDLQAKIDELTQLRQFDRAVSGLTLDPVKRDALETLFKAEQPESAIEWAAEKAQLFGWVNAPTTTTQTQTKEPPKTLATEGTAPTPVRVYTDNDDPITWSPDRVQKIIREKGKREGERWLRQKFDEARARAREGQQ